MKPGIRLIRSTPPGGAPRPRRRRLSRLRAALLPITVRALVFLFGLIPHRIALAVGRVLGRLAWRLSGRDRRRALEHLSFALAELPEEERARIARASLLSAGMNLAELLHFLKRSKQ